MSGHYGEMPIWHIYIADQDVAVDMEDNGKPGGYYVIAETEVKAYNAIRRDAGPLEYNHYKKSAKTTKAFQIGTTNGNQAPGVLCGDYGV